ncbi:V4R domain-containing protein [Aminipila luticellarii]|uniref:4-vinyl reductase n=1 Tax=Aminipila luticellarii TaxID=2507160 RepID=A0A410PWC5_9FIRM|nr:V4R domain-containing protein [Aminipila luticellarii]QAT43253.1 4-vinyl reductase [Aminipila luticellarii]
MPYILQQEKDHHTFEWESLGDIRKGRGELGEEMPVMVYRLMQYTMLDVLSKACGNERANECFRQAGYLAGTEFAQNVLDLKAEWNVFLSDLQRKLKELKIGILRMEALNEVTGELVLTVGEDLDCSGIPVTNETVCYYDEGFIAGILEAYTGKKYSVREIDCWANGDRVCRFRGTIKEVNDI